MTHSSVPAFIAASLCLASCASTPASLNDNMIIPGERVGEVEIGMTLEELIAMKGIPRKTVPIPYTEATTYFFKGFTVAADDEVYWIVAKDPAYRTLEGVAPGVEQISARAALGKPDCVVTKGDMTVYDYGKVYFEVDNATSLVTNVGVLKKTATCNE